MESKKVDLTDVDTIVATRPRENRKEINIINSYCLIGGRVSVFYDMEGWMLLTIINFVTQNILKGAVLNLS
jgi:hypothetical protein